MYFEVFCLNIAEYFEFRTTNLMKKIKTFDKKIQQKNRVINNLKLITLMYVKLCFPLRR